MQKDQFPWKTLDTKIVYENPWIKIREDKIIHPDGREGIYGVMMSAPSVFVLALTEKQEMYIIGQYRYPTRRYSWELPAGSTDGEDPLLAAQRELREETGLIAEKWQNIGFLQSVNGLSDEYFHIFIAQQLTQTGQHAQDEEGINAVRCIPFSELLDMIKAGEMEDSQSVSAIMKGALYLGLLHQ